MINIIVGHRGVGKTSFLQRIKFYYQERMQPCHIFDLNHEIEKRSGQSISDIFLSQGEGEFRKTEIKIFNQIINESSCLSGAVYVALGAEFLGELPSSAKVIWLRRDSDPQGRIFLARSRSESHITPLAEFAQRYDENDKKFKKIFNKEILLGEGWDFTNAYEPALLGLKPANVEVSITLRPDYMTNPSRLDLFLQECLFLGVRYVELRDDLLSEEQIRRVASALPQEKVLISFRSGTRTNSLLDFSSSYATDWALELGDCPLSHTTVSSLHTRDEGEPIEEASERLLDTRADHYKFSPQVDSFIELWAGHRFYSEDADKRSFLPRSGDGRWSWYRLLQNKKMKLNFMRVSAATPMQNVDQPTLFDFLRHPEGATQFAAVLGSPIQYSRVPAEQHDFFKTRQFGFVVLPMTEDECNSLNISILERLGLQAAAVSAPLKNKMRQLCSHVDRRTEELGAVNAIVNTKFGWRGTNTDIAGIKSVFSSLVMPEQIAVWGGGSSRMLLRDILPHAHFFSARRGEEIWVEEQKPIQPEVVVWALGSSHMGKTESPPPDWRPQYIVDLNYSEDSSGIEYAMQTGAKYISGKALFKSQAEGQRAFWVQTI